MLDEVLVARRAALGAYTATVLRAVLGQRRALDIAHVRNGNYHVVVGVEIFGIELLRRVDYLRTTLVAVLLLHVEQLLLDDLHLHLDTRQNVVEILDRTLQLVALGHELLARQSYQRTQSHLDDSRRLQLRQIEARLQRLLGLVDGLRSSDDIDNLVDVVLRRNQTQNYMQPLFGLLQIEARTTYHTSWRCSIK